MLVLYHFGGAICAQKVRIALAEKGLAWDSRECAGLTLRDPEYLKLNPGGFVPTLVHDGVVLNESRIISEYIEEAFDGPALMPQDAKERHGARLWSKQIDDSLHLNVFILTFAAIMRDMFLGMRPEVRVKALPGLQDPVKRRISEELLDRGMASPWIAMAVGRFRRLLGDMESRLSMSPYLAGSAYSLADADYTPYLNRLCLLGLSGLITGKPAVEDWWSRMQQRPSYKLAILDWETAEEDARYQVGREQHAGRIRTFVQAA